jgi:hypothetical protein
MMLVGKVNLSFYMNDDEDVESLVGLPIALFTKTIFMTLNTPNTNVKELNDFFGKKWQV